MVKCPKCNSVFDDNVNYCENCGGKVIPQSDIQQNSTNVQNQNYSNQNPSQPYVQNQYPYGQPQQQYHTQPQPQQYQYQQQQPLYQNYQFNPAYAYSQPQINGASMSSAKSSLINLGKSPLFLTAIIMLTVGFVIDLISAAKDYVPAYVDSSLVSNIIFGFLTILTIVSFWLIYTNASKASGSLNNGITGLKIIKGVKIITCVLTCIFAGLCIIIGLLFTVMDQTFEEMFEELLVEAQSYGYYFEEMLSFMGILFVILGAAVLAVSIVFCRSICGTINSAVRVCYDAAPSPAGKVGAVFCFISGGFIVFGAVISVFRTLVSVYVLSLSDIIQLISTSLRGVSTILFGVVLSKYASIVEMEKYRAFYQNK